MIELPVQKRSPRDWSAVAGALKETREAHGVSVDDLASRADISRDDLAEFEAGVRVLAIYEVEDLAAALGVDLGRLFFDDPAPLFRGDDAGVEQRAGAERLASELMRQYLSVRALAG